MIDVINYAKALSSIHDTKYNGSFIGKIEYEKIIRKEGKKINYEARETKSNKWLSVIEIKCLSNNNLLEKMTVTIVLLSKKKDDDIYKEININDSIININKNHYIKFSEKDIYDFSNMVGDKNPIHLKGNRVVQGMLIIKKLINNYNISRNFIIKFLNPVYEMNRVYLRECLENHKKVIEGISNNFKYFKLFLEE